MPRRVVALRGALPLAIGGGVQNDGHHHQRHSTEQQQWIGLPG